MTLALRKGPAFEDDVAGHFAWYWNEAGEAVAWRFKEAVDAALVRLARQPGVGKQRKFRAAALQGLRSFRVDPPFDKILIFYRVDDRVLDAWRVMHGARDLPRRLRELRGSA